MFARVPYHVHDKGGSNFLPLRCHLVEVMRRTVNSNFLCTEKDKMHRAVHTIAPKHFGLLNRCKEAFQQHTKRSKGQRRCGSANANANAWQRGLNQREEGRRRMLLISVLGLVGMAGVWIFTCQCENPCATRPEYRAEMWNVLRHLVYQLQISAQNTDAIGLPTIYKEEELLVHLSLSLSLRNLSTLSLSPAM